MKKNSFENLSSSPHAFNEAPPLKHMINQSQQPSSQLKVNPFLFEDDECPVVSMQQTQVQEEQSSIGSPQKIGRDAQISQMLRNFTLHQHTQSMQKIRGQGNLSPTPSIVPVLKKSTPTKQQSPKGTKNSSGKKKRHHSSQITVSDFDHHSANGPEPPRGRLIEQSRKKNHNIQQQQQQQQHSGAKKKAVLVIKREFIKKQQDDNTTQQKQQNMIAAVVVTKPQLMGGASRLCESFKARQSVCLGTGVNREYSNDSLKRKTGVIIPQGIMQDEASQVLIHKRRHNSQQQEDQGEQKILSKSMLRYNYFDSYLASSHEMASLELQIPVFSNATTRYSLDSKTLMKEQQRNNQNHFASFRAGINSNSGIQLHKQLPSPPSRDIDLVVPFSRSKSRKSQEFQKQSPKTTLELKADHLVEDDEDLTLFEREDESNYLDFQNIPQSSNCPVSAAVSVNDENANIISNLNENHMVKKTVAKIQKDKVKFNPPQQPQAVTSHTQKFEQGTLSKISISNTRDKFETIINSAGLRGLIMNPILGKTQSQPKPQQQGEPSPAKRSSSGSTLRRMKSENIFGSHSRGGGEGNHSQNNRIEVPKVVKAIHNEKSIEDHSPIVSADQIEIELPQAADPNYIQLLNLKHQQPSSSDESQGASSRVPKSLLLDNFLSKSKERIASGNSLSPKQKQSNNSTAANSSKSSQENSYEQYTRVKNSTPRLLDPIVANSGQTRTNVQPLLLDLKQEQNGPTFSTFISRRSATYLNNTEKKQPSFLSSVNLHGSPVKQTQFNINSHCKINVPQTVTKDSRHIDDYQYTGSSPVRNLSYQIRMRRKNQVSVESQLLLSSKQLVVENSPPDSKQFGGFPTPTKDVSSSNTPTSLAQRSRSRTSYQGAMISSENINE